MILDEYVVAIWKSNSKDWYESKGYKLEEGKHRFLCRPEDLLPKSNIKIRVLCDYCQEVETLIPFERYKRKVLDVPIQKYACSKCRQRKVEDMSLYKKGVKYSHQIKYEQVVNMFEGYGYKLLTSESEYNKVAQRLEYICPKHGLQSNSYNDLQQGKGCKYCGYEKTAQSKIKYTYEDVKKLFESRNYVLLDEDKYKHYTDKILKYKCLKHPNEIQDVKFSNFLTLGNGCKFCAIEERSKLARKDYEEVKDIFNQKGLDLLEENYINHTTDMKYSCRNKPDIIQVGNLAEIKARTHCCSLCYYENNYGENHHSWQGGITPLHKYLRANIAQWKLDTMKKYNYKCVLSNEPFKVIHHLYNFKKILYETLELTKLPLHSEINKYTIEELNFLSATCLDLHYKYGLGVLLTNKLHKLFHSLYGYDNTENDFDEFIIRYNMGEFKFIA